MEQRYAWLLDTAADARRPTVGTGKVTYLLSPRQKLVGYLQHETFRQSSFFAAGTNQPIQTSDALPSLVFPVTVWKGEYNAAVTDALYVEARVGGYLSDAAATFKSTAPRIVDVGANTRQRRRAGAGAADRPPAGQWLAELPEDRLGRQPHVQDRRRVHERPGRRADFGYGNPCNCVSTLNNGVPAQVQISWARTCRRTT